MKTLAQSLKNNWYIIAATLLLVVSTELLMGIMKYNADFDSFYLRSFFCNLILRIVALVGGICFTYVAGGVFNYKASGIVAAISTVFTISFSGIIFDENPDYNYYHIWLTAALLSLSFYYTNNCVHSTKHTIFYYIMITALAVVSADEIEFFIVLSASLVLFVVNRISIKQKSSLAINYVFSVLAIIAMTCMVVSKMDEYFGIKFIEGSSIHPEAVLLTTEPFKTSRFFNEIADAPSAYNLTKIFGYYGYVAGTAMCVVIALFVSAVFARCFSATGSSKSVGIIAAVTIFVKCVAGFFVSFSIISSSYVRMPILSDGSVGYLAIGLLIGMLIAPPENLCFISNFLNGFIKPDEPNLTLVGSKEDDDV